MQGLLPWEIVPTWGLVLIFLGASLCIALAGTRATKIADRLAIESGLGHAWFGAIILGATTSLSGLATSVAAAAQGRAELAVSNALGGIAAQTFFLVLGDLAYRKANLEHSAASLGNLLYGAVLLVILSTLSAAMAIPDLSWWGVHPFSIMMVAFYIGGLRIVTSGEKDAMWGPQKTAETEDEEDEPDENAPPLWRMWVAFVSLGLALAASGYFVATVGGSLAERTNLTESMVGTMLTAISTSLPELVTTIAAVRQGSVTLAVAGVLGGNAFDCLFVSLADVAYRENSIFTAIGSNERYLVALTAIMTAVLLLGLLRRERHGVANIGFESMLVGALYLGSLGLLFG